ncbi:hypothetical protein WCN79_04965 [Xanthomonas axonopodis pv. vasculorum]|uniref:hypothetical protein n=1 Tax=Xanthomonas axonopodis TaxID=53413 RepID=UPI00149612BA|nr:hypothetical protein [Xanthomonas axonopodis]QKD87917.1 hypothetical protein XAV_18255 [Xanthomonas axonopodis pv. vasculorum]
MSESLRGGVSIALERQTHSGKRRGDVRPSGLGWSVRSAAPSPRIGLARAFA